jgi:Ni/Co efflux regulator RcnB
MRKIMIAALVAASLTPVAAQAQSWGEVRRGQNEVREGRRDLQDARRYGDRDDVRDARRELREDRRELREDWRDYRRTNRDAFRRGAYQAPRGYRYQPVVVGQRFAPIYYGRNYWVNDWQRYRLARPAYNQQWVRYGNDVALVDLRSGRVLRVYDRFFW